MGPLSFEWMYWKLTGSFSCQYCCFSFLIFSLFLQCLPMSQNNSVERGEDTMFPSLELLEFTSGFHLPCVAFTSRNHDRKLCGWCVDKSWLIVQALPPVPEKPGLIHCNFAETKMASSLTWCCLNRKNEFSPLTEARKELSPYTSTFCVTCE